MRILLFRRDADGVFRWAAWPKKKNSKINKRQRVGTPYQRCLAVHMYYASNPSALSKDY